MNYTNDTQTTNRATNKSYPAWSVRADKAIPKVGAPSLRSLGSNVMANMQPTMLLLIVRPFIGVAAFVAMAITGWWITAPAVLWFLYGSTATATHHLIHGSLGLSPKARRFWLTVLGFVIVESGHAWQATHVMHHRDGTDLPDPEGYVEYLTWAQLPLGAFQWRYRIGYWGWKNGQHRARTTFEMIVLATITAASIALIPVTPLLFIYVAMMQLGTFLFALVLAKGPQNDYGRESDTPLFLVHAKLLGWLLFNHHLHLEHHAYPKVPIARLHHLRPHIEGALTDKNVKHVHLA